MNKEDILFDSVQEKEAAERVLALVRVKNITSEITELKDEITSYATNVDKILERNNLTKRYLDRVEPMENVVELDADIETADFRVKEVAEDFIKRINTRINLVRNNQALIEELRITYGVKEENIERDIRLSRLNEADFQE